MKYLWQNDEFVDDNTLTVNINRLRKKMEEIGANNMLTTKRGKDTETIKFKKILIIALSIVPNKTDFSLFTAMSMPLATIYANAANGIAKDNIDNAILASRKLTPAISFIRSELIIIIPNAAGNEKIIIPFIKFSTRS